MVRAREFHDTQRRAHETPAEGFGALRALNDTDATHTEAPPQPDGAFSF
jgi:hypothetical protein